MFLSGTIVPVESMPAALQYVSYDMKRVGFLIL